LSATSPSIDVAIDYRWHPGFLDRLGRFAKVRGRPATPEQPAWEQQLTIKLLKFPITH
jgi:hypothetical protein